MLTIKKLDEISLFVFMSLYLVYDYTLQGYFITALAYMFFYTMADSADDLKAINKHKKRKKIPFDVINYSKIDKVKLAISLPFIIIGVSFESEKIFLIGYILLLIVYLYQFLKLFKNKFENKEKRP